MPGDGDIVSSNLRVYVILNLGSRTQSRLRKNNLKSYSKMCGLPLTDFSKIQHMRMLTRGDSPVTQNMECTKQEVWDRAEEACKIKQSLKGYT